MYLYSLLREFADSWMLLFLFCFFCGVVFWAYRPGSRVDHEESANLIFRNEDAPAQSGNDHSDAISSKMMKGAIK